MATAAAVRPLTAKEIETLAKTWYKKLDDESRVAANDLMFSDYDAAKFCDRMEKAAQAVAADSSITKFTRS